MNGKGSGSLNIVPEMLEAELRAGGFTGIITDLIHTILGEMSPKEWVDAILIPTLKGQFMEL